MPDPVGIDFGTSTCKMVRYMDGRLVVIPLDRTQLRELLPSVILFDHEQDRIVVGSAAEGRRFSQRDNMYPSSSSGHAPIKLGLTNPDFAPLEFQGKHYDALAMAEEIFLEMLRAASEYLGYEPSEAVLTAPAYFTQAQTNAIRQAAENAGIYVRMMRAEPVAAAFAYSWPNWLQGTQLVYDFGGGTFDTTVISVSEAHVQVFAKLGNPHLGGLLLTRIVYDRFFRRPAEEATSLNLSLDEETLNDAAGVAKEALFQLAEEAKVHLSSNEYYLREIAVDTGEGKPATVNITITRDELEEAVSGHITGTLETVQEAVALAGLTLGEIDYVLPVGGVTRMPLIRNQLASLFGAEKILQPLDPDLLVAQGAALLDSEDNARPTVVSDVLARSLRRRVPKSTKTKVIIKRTTPLEAAITTIPFSWPGPNVGEIALDLCEGEAEDYEDNEPLGTVIIRPVTRLTGQTPVEVTFKYDPDRNVFAPSARVVGGPSLPVQLRPGRRADLTGITPDTIAIRTADIVLCLDVTRSFQRSLMPTVREQILAFEQRLRTNGLQTRFAVVAFGDPSLPGEETLVHPFSGTEGTLRSRLSSLPEYDGGDNPEDVAQALRRVSTVLAASSPEAQKMVILATDAAPKSPEVLSALIPRLKGSEAVGYVFAPTDPHVPAYLALAGETDGEYVDIHADLTAGLERAASRLLRHPQ